MAKNKLTSGKTFQAVCNKGDFNGRRRTTGKEARQDAAAHNAKPGCANHIISIIETNTVVKQFVGK